MTYGVDFDSLPSMDESDTVIVPETRVPVSAFQALAGINPLHSSADNAMVSLATRHKQYNYTFGCEHCIVP